MIYSDRVVVFHTWSPSRSLLTAGRGSAHYWLRESYTLSTHPSIADADNATTTTTTTTIAMINVCHFFELEKKWQLCGSERKETSL